MQCGKAHFATEKKRFTIIDAPGHKSFVPNMITGASEADIGILVISARKGEFETGFDRGGQTREHAMLAKSCGLKFLFVVINKMDDPTVNYSQERCGCALRPPVFTATQLRGVQREALCVSQVCRVRDRQGCVAFGDRSFIADPSPDTFFLPICGLTGGNLKDPYDSAVCPWYKFVECAEMLALHAREYATVLGDCINRIYFHRHPDDHIFDHERTCGWMGCMSRLNEEETVYIT